MPEKHLRQVEAGKPLGVDWILFFSTSFNIKNVMQIRIGAWQNYSKEFKRIMYSHSQEFKEKYNLLRTWLNV